MANFADRVKETTTTTGTGNITLAGAAAGTFITFNTAFGLNKEFYYCIAGQSGTEWEVGQGYLSGTTTLVRDLVYSGSNGTSFVNFSAGTKDVFCTVPAIQMVDKGMAMALRMNLAMQ